MNSEAKVYIIGAGISGLISAIELEKAGFSPTIIEKTNSVGGRVKSDLIEEYLLDYGFQVLLTQYPAARRYLDYDKLQLQKFAPGAVIFKNGQSYKIGDPLRDPSFLWSTMTAAVGSISDKLKILKLSNQVKRTDLDTIFQEEEKTTLQYLKDYGFSQKIIDHFFLPFFSGIFLEPHLDTSCRMFLFVYKMFSEGNASIPKAGMQAIPNQLQGQLQKSKFLFNTSVKSIDDGQIHLVDGLNLDADMILIATDPTNILKTNKPKPTQWHACTTLYFKAPSSTLQQAIIGLIADPNALVNNVHFPSDLQSQNNSKALLSATVVKAHQLNEADLVKKVKAELATYCGIQDVEWIKSYVIEKALPKVKELKYRAAKTDIHFGGNVFLCGDHLANGSLNAAMESGQQAAEMMLAHHLQNV